MSDPVVYPNRARAMRERLLSLRPSAPEKVEVDGATYFVRAAMLSDRDEVRRMAIPSGTSADDVAAGNIAIDRMLAAACIKLVVDEVGAPVFEAADFDAIRAAPIGSAMERLGMVALKKLNPEVAPGEAPGGPSEPASSTSSPTA